MWDETKHKDMPKTTFPMMRTLPALVLSLFLSSGAIAQSGPVAIADAGVKQMSAQSIQLPVLANDQFTAQTITSVAIMAGPAHGTVVIHSNGTWANKEDDLLIYASDQGFAGVDTMSYEIVDNQGNTSVATVTIQVVDEPNPIMPQDDWLSIGEDSGGPVYVAINDSFGVNGPGPHPVTISGNPASGYADVDTNGTYTDPTDDIINFTPEPNFNGSTTFQYYILDAAGNRQYAYVTVDVAPDGANVDQPFAADDSVTMLPSDGIMPIYFFENDTFGGDGPWLWGDNPEFSQPEHGTVEFYDIGEANGYFVFYYTPDTGFAGIDFFEYTLYDSDHNSSTATVYITVLGPSYIYADVFFDANANGMRDEGEPDFAEATVSYTKNDGPATQLYAQDGTFYVETSSGGYYGLECSVFDPERYSVTVPQIDYIPTPSEPVGKLFAVTAVPFTDAGIRLIGTEPTRPGFPSTFTVSVRNYGTEAIPAGMLTFTKDPALGAATALPSGASETATGFTYAFGPLPALGHIDLEVTYTLPVIPDVSLGDWLHFSASLTGVAQDDVASNNQAQLNKEVVGSYDPNDITEAHGPKIAMADFTADDYLYYTIRFENTGTFPAEFVRIESTLDPKLDPSTLRMIAASHSCQLQRNGDMLEWKFDDINLAPSVPDTETGKGYAVYAIKAQPGITVGDIIAAQADIFFDYNPPVVTETFYTEFVDTLSAQDAGQAIFRVWPNPVSDVLRVQGSIAVVTLTLTDASGRTVAAADQDTLDVRNLGAGVYVLKIEAAGKTYAAKLIKN